MRRSSTILVVLAAVAVLAGTAGCGGPAPQQSPAPSTLPAATGNDRLAGVCPATVVIQDDWEPQAERSALYQLIGPGAHIDSDRKRVDGPLVTGGKDTGVRVEVRAGGAAIGFGSVPAQMYVDHSIMLGAASTDQAMASSAKAPTMAVVAPLNKSPQMIMWDPATHPDWHSIADIGAAGATVLISKGLYYPPLLVAKGLLKPNQLDSSYTGSPVRFVSDPRIAQQGYATNEPYVYEHEIASWKKPVRYQLLADVGYQIYPEAIVARSAELPSLAPCLSRLVPILQRAQRDYFTNPGPTNQLITDTVSAYNDGWTYSLGVANYTTTTLKDQHIVANDTSGALGGMDPARVQATINTFTPLLAASGADVRPGLTAADLATNQFIDPTVKTGW